MGRIPASARRAYVLFSSVVISFSLIAAASLAQVPNPGHSGADIETGSITDTQIADDTITAADIADNIALDNTLVINLKNYDLDIIRSAYEHSLFISGTSGNVSIGKTSPASALDVSGTIRAQALCDESGGNCKDLSTGWTTSPWSISGSNVYRSSGNVGIGEQNPVSALELSSGNWILLNPGQGQNGGINFYETGTKGSTDVQYGAKIVYDGINDRLMIVTRENGADVYGISVSRYNGYVAIGKALPASNLDVSGTIRAHNICDESGANCKDLSAGWAMISPWTVSGSNVYRPSGMVGVGIYPAYALDVSSAASNAYPARVASPEGYLLFGPANNGWSHFSTDRPGFYFNTGVTVDTGNIGSYDEDLSLRTSGTTRMTISNSNGYVGIGTSAAPATPLEVRRSTNGEIARFGGATDDTTYDYVTMYSGSTRQGIMLYDGAWTGCGNRPNEFCIKAENSNDLSLYSDQDVVISGTYVGIGTTNPGQTLDVNGRIRVGSNAQTEIYSSGNRLIMRGENTDDVAEFANYGLYLPQDVVTGLYVRGGTRLNYAGTSEFVVDNSGNVNADSGTLYVDAANNRIGIRTASPGHLIDARVGGTSNKFVVREDNNVGIELRSETSSGTPYIDFANDASEDYDMRLIMTNNNRLDIDGGGIAVESICNADGRGCINASSLRRKATCPLFTADRSMHRYGHWSWRNTDYRTMQAFDGFVNMYGLNVEESTADENEWLFWSNCNENSDGTVTFISPVIVDSNQNCFGAGRSGSSSYNNGFFTAAPSAASSGCYGNSANSYVYPLSPGTQSYFCHELGLNRGATSYTTASSSVYYTATYSTTNGNVDGYWVRSGGTLTSKSIVQSVTCAAGCTNYESCTATGDFNL